MVANSRTASFSDLVLRVTIYNEIVIFSGSWLGHGYIVRKDKEIMQGDDSGRTKPSYKDEMIYYALALKT